MISKHQWGLFALLVWGVVFFMLLHRGPYGVEEQAAKAVLLDWSIADHVANSIVTLGVPDFRTLFWFPLSFLFPGQILAVKAVAIAVTAATAWGLYRWQESNDGEESALLATGLWLISPLVLLQLDQLSPGVFVVGCFMAAHWVDRAYRAQPLMLGGMFFTQLGLAALVVSLHPVGLVYPVLLAWNWYRQPVTVLQQRFFLGGLGFMTVLSLALNWGWGGVVWFHNPVSAWMPLWHRFVELDGGQTGWVDWLSGATVMSLLLWAIIARRRVLHESLLGRCLWWGTLVSGLNGDATFALLGLTLLLYSGLGGVLSWSATRLSFMGQRGWVLMVVFVVSTLSMQGDRDWYEIGKAQIRTVQDQLIETLASSVEQVRAEAEKKHAPEPRLRVASQWPARTMLACRCDTLPLPPAAKDAASQLAMMKGLTHLILSPSQSANIGLVRNLSLLGNEVETASLQPGGVMLVIKKPNLDPAKPQPALEEPAPPAPGDPIKPEDPSK